MFESRSILRSGRLGARGFGFLAARSGPRGRATSQPQAGYLAELSWRLLGAAARETFADHAGERGRPHAGLGLSDQPASPDQVVAAGGGRHYLLHRTR